MRIGDMIRAGLGLAVRPRAATQPAGGGSTIVTAADLDAALRANGATASGARVTPDTAMRVGAVFASVRIISDAVANLPLAIMRRVGERERRGLRDDPLWLLLRRRPNRWQSPAQFRRMMQAQVLLRGNAYALIVRSRGRVMELIPLDPDRMTVEQGNDLGLVFRYRTLAGAESVFGQSEILHLAGLTLDGVRGVSPITFARETIGLSMSLEGHGATMARNGLRPSSVLVHPNKLGPEALENLRASIDAFRGGGTSEGRALVLEEGIDLKQWAMSAEDAQWIEGRKLSRSDIAMFFGVPPHMIGDTEKSTSWGTGIEQQSIGFVTYTLESHLTMWEEAIDRDLVGDDRPNDYARFNRKALVRGDIKTRQEFYVAMLQWGVLSPNEVRALEDENPRAAGDIYYSPPNTAGAPSSDGAGPEVDEVET